MKDKIIAITGSNIGIGKATADALARQGAHIVMLCRNPDKGKRARLDLIESTKNENIELIICDLSSFDSIRKAAQTFKEKYDRLDILINNAGFMAGERTETKEGFESSFGVNHLGHFLLTQQLMEPILAAPKARLIHLSSEGHKLGVLDWDDLNAKKGYTAIRTYCRSKMCNVLFSNELARRLEAKGLPITSNSLHPGVVRSNFGSGTRGIAKFAIPFIRPFMITNEKGAATSVHLASSPKVEGITGKYWAKSKEKKAHKFGRDTQNMEKLWAISEDLTGVKFDV